MTIKRYIPRRKFATNSPGRSGQRDKCIVLLSGGIDSAVSLVGALKNFKILFAITFDYGQRAARQELAAARAQCRYFKVKHLSLDLSWLGTLSRSTITQKTKISLTRLISLADVWVPNRNGLFLAVAATMAEALDAKYVVTGFNREEGREFQDNSKKFVDTFNKTLRFSTLKQVKVKSFVQDLNKSQIVSRALRYKIPFGHIYSCYLGKKRMCGKCASCLRLKRGLSQAGARAPFAEIF